MTKILRPASPRKLKQLYLEREAARQRFDMAVQTVNGAQKAYLNADVAFTSAARQVHGSDATFEWDATKRQLVFKARHG